MFNNIFCEMKGKKVIHWGGGAGGNGGTILITSWKCNFSIYLDIQAIITLYAFYLFFMFSSSIHSFFYLLLKSDISGTQTASPPTVFNLQASNWVHCEEETGAYYQL